MYVGETSHSLGMRMEENRKEADKSGAEPHKGSSDFLVISDVHTPNNSVYPENINSFTLCTT